LSLLCGMVPDVRVDYPCRDHDRTVCDNNEL
jgi:hypothetical protein